MASTEPVDTTAITEGRLPLYTHDGDLDTIPDGWTRAGCDTADGRPLYAYAGDTRGCAPTAAGVDSPWVAFEGELARRTDMVDVDYAALIANI